MNYRIKKILKDVFVFATGNASSKVMLLCLMPLYTTRLSTSEYGQADIINTLVELLVPVFTLCISDAVFRFSIKRDDVEQGVLFFVGTEVLLCGNLLVLLLTLFCHSFFDFKFSFFLFFIFFSYSLKNFLGCYVRGLDKPILFAVSGAAGTFSLVCFNIVFLVLFDCRLEGYLYSIILSNFISSVILFVKIPLNGVKKSYFLFKTKGKLYRRKLFNYGFPIIPNTISWWLNNALNRYILLLFYGSAMTGVFVSAAKIPAVINLLSGIFQQAWQYSSAYEYGKKDTSIFYSDVFSLYGPFIVLSSSAILLINPLICSFALRGDFIEAWQYVPLLIFAAVQGCFSIFFGGIFTAAKNSRVLMYSTVIGSGVNALLCFILVPYLSIWGILIALNVSYLIVLLIRILRSFRILKIKANWHRLLISLILVLSQSVVASFVQGHLHYFVSLCFFVLIALINLHVFFVKEKKSRYEKD